MAVGAAGVTPTPAVRLAGLTRLYEGTAALRAIDLHVDPGEVVLVRGPNGSGKTTLLRLIATAITPTFGRGEVLGEDLLAGRDAIRRRTELLGHRSRLYEDLSARENLRFVCTLHGLPVSHIPDVLGRVGLAGAADERVRTFSQGMRQRAALARILLRRPELLLLDEPYAGLDEQGMDLVDLIVRETRDAGGTVLLATHDAERGARAARRVSLEGGRIVAEEPIT